MDTCAEGVETHDDLQLIRELGVSMVQGYIFGKPGEAAEIARELANSVTVEADGFACTREPRHRLMRRAITCIDGADGRGEAAQHLLDGRAGRMPGRRLRRGRSSPSTSSASAPVRGIVRWAQSGKFGVQFDQQFDLAPPRAQEGAPRGRSRCSARPTSTSGERRADARAAGEPPRLRPVLAVEIVEIDDRRPARHRRQIGDVERHRRRAD